MTGKTLRFVDFLLDSVIFFLFLVILIMIFKNMVPIEHVKWISVVLFFLYYFVFEYFMGQTPGKMITKTKVESTSGTTKNYFLKILIRTITRFIPIDILSHLFTSRGLHDIFSMTTIVKVNKNQSDK